MKKRLKVLKKYSVFQKFILFSSFLTLLILLIITVFVFFQKTQLLSRASSDELINVNDPFRKAVFPGLEKADNECGQGNYALKKSRDKNGKRICTAGPEKLDDLKSTTSIKIPLNKQNNSSVRSTTTDPLPEGFGARFFCYGDGKSGNRVQVIFAKASDTSDNFTIIKNRIKMWAALQTYTYYWSAYESGEGRFINYVHDQNCLPVVDYVVLSPEGDDNFDNLVSELQQKGYDREDRKYMIFSNAEINPGWFCGIGNLRRDDNPDLNNTNNSGPSYGEIDRDCWFTEQNDWYYTVPAHELMHNLGGVQDSSPHSSKGGHCTDEWDLMCYSDPPYYPPMQIRCPNEDGNNYFDCHHDDYYSTKVNIGEYLFTHWNTANSSFLINNPTSNTDISGPLRIKVQLKDTTSPFPQSLTIRELSSSDCVSCNSSCTNFVCNPQRDKTYNPTLGYAQWDYYTSAVKYSFGITNLPASWKITSSTCGTSTVMWEPGWYGDTCVIEVDNAITKTNVRGFLWHDDDTDPNGVKNAVEPLIANIQVNLYKLNAQGKPRLLQQIASNNTSEANYQFKKLDFGKYTLDINRIDAQNQGLDINTCNRVTSPVNFPAGNNKYLYCLKGGKLILKKWDQGSKTLKEVTGGVLNVDGKFSELRVDFPLVTK